MASLREKFLESYMSRFENHDLLYENFYGFSHRMENGLTAEIGVQLGEYGGGEFRNQLHVGGYRPVWASDSGRPKYVNLHLVTVECKHRFGEDRVEDLTKLVERYNGYIGCNTISLTRDPPRIKSEDFAPPEALGVSSLETPPNILLDFLGDLERELERI